jgi:hypothetical protein
VVVAGTKQGFCFEDSFKYVDGGKSHGYDCSDQGITSGWGEWYDKQLVGQWIDITGVPEGEYIVRVRINTGQYSPIFDEGEVDIPTLSGPESRFPARARRSLSSNDERRGLTAGGQDDAQPGAPGRAFPAA